MSSPVRSVVDKEKIQLAIAQLLAYIEAYKQRVSPHHLTERFGEIDLAGSESEESTTTPHNPADLSN